MYHKDAVAGDIHIIHNWKVADAAARLALVVAATDEGKLAWQEDNDGFYLLADAAGPTWLPCLGVPGSTGTAGNTVLNGVVAPGAGVGVNGDFYIDTVAKNIYGPKAAGAWPAAVSLGGPAGSNGVGVPTGGTAGQVLSKIDATNYNTQWVAQTGGSGGTSVARGKVLDLLNNPVFL